jgi:hypothetical protein
MPNAVHRNPVFQGAVEGLSARGPVRGTMRVCTDGDAWASGVFSVLRDEDRVLAPHGRHGRSPSQGTEIN